MRSSNYYLTGARSLVEHYFLSKFSIDAGKLSHDADGQVASAAIFGMGIMGAGTNHAKIAGLLRQLAAYYSKDANVLFVVRIAQGLLYLGKGLMTLSPVHSDRLLVNNVGMGSLLTVMTVMLNADSLFFTHNMHWLLY